MQSFYTYTQVLGNNILVRRYENGKHYIEKIPFEPTLYIPTTKPNAWRTLYDNRPLEPMRFGSIKEARDFKEQYKDVAGFSIHGMDKWNYQWINENYKGDIEYDLRQVKILFLDIECISDDGSFPDIQAASAPITLISLHLNGVTTVLGLKDFQTEPTDEFVYKKFDSEHEMLKYFVAYNSIHKPDVWSGWNTSKFDIPYIVNRLMRLFDETMVKQLSPFNYIREKTIEIRGREIQTFDIYGIVDLDYLELYQKFTYNARESYALGFIAQEELGQTKVELPGETFHDSYHNHFETFVRYNAVDTLLVKKLDNKMKLIELAFSIAYLIKCNVPDVYKTVLPWEVFIYNFLADRKIAVPPRRKVLSANFDGAWVKNPTPNLYGWMMSFDFASLYPSIIRQWNLSPEKYVQSAYDTRPSDWIDNNELAQKAAEFAKDNDLSVAANGSMYRKDGKGFLVELMEYCMDGRKIAKKEMLKLEAEYQQTKDESLIPKIAALNNRQMALKILANSAYGAIGNEGFLYYEMKMAEAITLTGQLSDIHLAQELNKMMNLVVGTENVDYVAMGDTDSVYLNVEALVAKYCQGKTRDEIVEFLDKFGNDVCQKVINASIDHVFNVTNAFDKMMTSKREAIASKTLIRAAKNYAMYVHNSEGVSYDPPKIKVMGIEVVRSSTPKWCRGKLKDAIKYIFEKDEKFIRNYFNEVYEEFKTLPIEDIAFPRGVSDIDKWVAPTGIYRKACPIHVRGSLLYNHHMKQYNVDMIRNGDKIKFVYLKLPNPIGEDVIAFPTSGKFPKELKLENYINYDLQFEKVFKGPLQSLTDAARWHLEDVATLDDFFG